MSRPHLLPLVPREKPDTWTCTQSFSSLGLHSLRFNVVKQSTLLVSEVFFSLYDGLSVLNFCGHISVLPVPFIGIIPYAFLTSFIFTKVVDVIANSAQTTPTHWLTNLRCLLVHTQADSESCLERASLLIEIHLRDLTTQKALLTRNEMVAQRVSDI